MDIQNTQMTYPTENPQNSLNLLPKRPYIVGQWEDLEEDYALEGLKSAVMSLKLEAAPSLTKEDILYLESKVGPLYPMHILKRANILKEDGATLDEIVEDFQLL